MLGYFALVSFYQLEAPKGRTMIVESVSIEQYPELLAVWEDSIRATHDFISDDDIAVFKPRLMEQGFPEVTLRCVKGDNGAILGFIGVKDNKIQMLYVLNKVRGMGIGKALMAYAMQRLAANRVDVNEQNPAAVEFYESMGFKVIDRSDVDELGKPLPVLHMLLKA